MASGCFAFEPMDQLQVMSDLTNVSPMLTYECPIIHSSSASDPDSVSREDQS